MEAKVATVQNRCNLVDRASEGVLEYCERRGIGFIPWCPLAAGDLAKVAKRHSAITVEAYPYGTGSTVLAAAFFSDPEFEARNGTGYDSVQRVTDGRRFRDREELLAAQAAEPSTLVLWHILDTENNSHHRDLLDMSVLYPGGAIASDAMPWTLPDGSTYTGDAWPLPEDATSHPREIRFVFAPDADLDGPGAGHRWDHR